jgi:hypothetical protein
MEKELEKDGSMEMYSTHPCLTQPFNVMILRIVRVLLNTHPTGFDSRIARAKRPLEDGMLRSEATL